MNAAANESQTRTAIWSLLIQIKKIVAPLLLLLFTLVASVTVAGRIATNNLTRPGTFHAFIQESQLTDHMPLLLADFLASEAAQAIRPAYLNGISAQVWENALERLLTDEWVATHLHMAVDDWFIWLATTGSLPPNLRLDLTPIHQSLNGPRSALIVLPMLQGVPACATPSTPVTFLEDTLLSCLPSNQDATLLAQEIATAFANRLPSEASLPTLHQSGSIQSDTIQFLYQLRQGKEVLDKLFILGTRLSLLILSLYALLHASSVKNMLAALPRPFYFAGSLSLLLWLVGQITLAYGANLIVTTWLPITRPEIYALYTEGVQLFSRQMRWAWLGWSLLLPAVGLVIQLSTRGFPNAIKRWQQPDDTTYQQKRVRRQFRR